MPIIISIFICIALFAAMLTLIEGGVRLARKLRRDDDTSEAAAIEGAIFALLGLLLGFAFAGAMGRLDVRRELIVQEANAISTAYMRVDLLPADDQPAVRELFKSYLRERLEIYQAIERGADPAPDIADTTRLQGEIWDAAVAASNRETSNHITNLVLPAVNDMIDVTSSRMVALRTHMPILILSLLIGVALISSLMAGYAMKRNGRRYLLYGGIYALAVSITIYTVLDIDNPRGGLIRLDAADQILRDLQATM